MVKRCPDKPSDVTRTNPGRSNPPERLSRWPYRRNRTLVVPPDKSRGGQESYRRIYPADVVPARRRRTSGTEGLWWQCPEPQRRKEAACLTCSNARRFIVDQPRRKAQSSVDINHII